MAVEGFNSDLGLVNYGFVGLYDGLMSCFSLELVHVVEEKLRERRKIQERN